MMTLPSNFFAQWQQQIPNSLFRKRHRRMNFSGVLKGLSSPLIDSPLPLDTSNQVRQKIPHSINYLTTFDPALIFSRSGSLSICEVFGEQFDHRDHRIRGKDYRL